jgi:thymidylate synthase (FAD)
MGKVIIDQETTISPIVMIGEKAGSCWGADIMDREKNFKRGVDCIQSGHGRALEFPNIIMTLDGYSARVIRELYTHIGGAPTRLQSSTRYIDYKGFDYVTPPKIANFDKSKVPNHTCSSPQSIYANVIRTIESGMVALEKYGLPREDIAMLLPLCMATKVELKVNLRELIQIFNQRLCTRAYWEFRELMTDIKNALIEYGKSYWDYLPGARNEWELIAKHLFVPKCEKDGVCYEKYSCGRAPKAERKEFN